MYGEWQPVDHHTSASGHTRAQQAQDGDDDLEDTSDSSQQDLSCPWYHQPKFSRYWQHYAAMQSWMRTYSMMQKFNRYPFVMGNPHMMMNPYGIPPPFMSPPFYSPHWNPYSQRAPSQQEASSPYFHNYTPRNHNNVPQTRTRRPDIEQRHQEYSDDEESDDESMEIELSEEMINFFKASQKFREERDKAKAEAERKAKASKKKSKKNPLNAEDRINCRAPVERPDEGRRKEMKILYGQNSARIHSMETAMQMQFDRNCDRLRPAYWPIVALKL